ncbi:phosphotransferase, partial [Rhizobiaceae sp. 2RAB30]
MNTRPAVAPTPDFDPEALRTFLADHLGRNIAALAIRATEGGMSNPTYFVDADGWRAVLRKQPRMQLAKSAHAIDREFRVLKALAASDVPVPEAYHFHEDPDLLGTPFYLMEWLEGRVYTAYAMPGLSAQERSQAYDS